MRCLVIRRSQSGGGLPKFLDPLDTASFAPPQNGYQWGSDNSNSRGSTALVAGTSWSGTHALRYRFLGAPYAGAGNTGDDASAERRIYFPTVPVLWARLKLRVADNYFHRGEPAGNNNKFPFSVWGGGDGSYNDPPTPGMTLNLYPRNDGTGASDLNVNYFTTPVNAQHWGAWPNAIGPADRGLWLDLILNFFVAPGPGQYGGCNIWRARLPGGPLQRVVTSNSNMATISDVPQGSNYRAGQSGFDSGYFLGAANSGFDEDTDFFMNRVELGDQNIYGVTV